MAKYHVALVRLKASSGGSIPIQTLPSVEEQIIDTAVAEASTIFPKEANLYWIITPLSADGWVKLGAKGNASVAPAPTAALEQGLPVFAKSEKTVEAPIFRRIAIKAV